MLGLQAWARLAVLLTEHVGECHNVCLERLRQERKDDAGKLVDQFIQTQNDGKIVVAEYAANIGKVASALRAWVCRCQEVNAVIAQSTASGVQAEVAFTGLKGALARLASGEASKALKGLESRLVRRQLKLMVCLEPLRSLRSLDTGRFLKHWGLRPALHCCRLFKTWSDMKS